MKKRSTKLLASAAAVTLTVAAALTGTYAWQSISQRVLNEAASEVVNAGGRLHDDFNGADKDIYVENFTDPEEGELIYARIRLSEYMEYGQDAGKNTEAEDRKASPVMEGASIKDQTTWTIYKPGDTGNRIHDVWYWEMGGSTIYMPTFNKNKDSLAPDLNGTFAGPDKDPATSEDRFADHYDYTLGESKYDTAIYDADENDVDEGDDALEDENILKVDERHQAKATLDATVITMEQWKAEGLKPGNYWVYDADGWAYWANPIKPGEATGLLLSGIKQERQPDESWYYAINAEGQFATGDDWGDEGAGTGFYKDGITDDGKLLMNLVTGSVKIITGEDGNKYIDNGDGTYSKIEEDGTFGEPIYPGEDGKPGNEDDRFIVIGEDGKKYVDNGDGTYSEVKDNGTLGDPIYPGEDGKIGTGDDKPVVTGENGKSYIDHGDGTFSEIKEDGTLGDMFCPGEDGRIGTEDDLPITVIDPADPTYGSKFAGPNADDSYFVPGADGVFGTDDDIKVWPNPTLESGKLTTTAPTFSVNVSAEGYALRVEIGGKLEFRSEVLRDDELASSQKVIWTLSGNTSSDTSISDTGLLTVGVDETVGGLLTVRGTAIFDPSLYAEHTVRVYEPIPLNAEISASIRQIVPGSDNTVAIDDVNFYILAYEAETDRALIFSKDQFNRPYATETLGWRETAWRDSLQRTYLGTEWITDYPSLNGAAIDTTITTKSYYNKTDYFETRDSVFLLSQADVDSAYKAGSSSDYTYAGERLPISNEMLKGGSWLFRSPYNDSSWGVRNNNGTHAGFNPFYAGVTYYRPAMWVQLGD